MIMAFFDVLGVASIMPFMAVLVNPEIIETNAYLAYIYSNFGFTNSQDFLYFLGLSVFVLLVISISFKAMTTYVQLRFILMREASIGKRLIAGYLNQPYVWFLNRHSADLGKNILSEVAEVVNSSMLSLMNIFAHGLVTLVLIILLIIVNVQVALVVSIVLISFYLLFFYMGRNIISNAGHKRLEANNERFKIVSEVFGSIKGVKVGGLERNFVDRFSKHAKIYAKSYASAQVLSQLPRFGLELIAFGGLLLMLLILMSGQNNLESVFPIIALYAFAGYRILPALQQVYNGFSLWSFSTSALQNLSNDINTLKLNNTYQDSFAPNIKFDKEIKLNNVVFSYPDVSKQTLNKLNIVIPALSSVGFVGSTGCGKTTSVDLILGLLEPQQGTLTVDNIIIDKSNRSQWLRNIGYVPQNIYLSDDSIASNIAFGIDENLVNQSFIEQAAKIANLDEFIQKELPDGYNTIIGERGVRLSGGQRQRIGIARALYHKPKILILDEATSSLDGMTEAVVMEAIENLGQEVTIIIVAHRLSTVRHCDNIYLLEKGQVKSSGSFDSLKDSDKQFRSMLDL